MENPAPQFAQLLQDPTDGSTYVTLWTQWGDAELAEWWEDDENPPCDGSIEGEGDPCHGPYWWASDEGLPTSCLNHLRDYLSSNDPFRTYGVVLDCGDNMEVIYTLPDLYLP